MRATLRFGVVLLAGGLCVGMASAVVAQVATRDATTADERDESWYYTQPSYRPNPRAIIHAKAQTRAAQRQTRLASMAWYGMSNSRPTGAPTPFTSRYSPVWEVPGGRPFTWHDRTWPTYVLYVR